MLTQLPSIVSWYTQPSVPGTCPKICTTRDVFQGRLDSFFQSLTAAPIDESECALLTAIAGEIGNNCFDHNLGQWRDSPGCWFEYGSSDQQVWIVLADRGRGMLASLQRVDPTIQDEQSALNTAFNKRLSGRAPEQRGNGLKFVRNVINGQAGRAVLCWCGSGHIGFGAAATVTEQLVRDSGIVPAGIGVCAIVVWNRS